MKCRTRILHALGWVSSGGVEQRRLLLARGLDPSRYENVLICQEANGVIADQLRDEGWVVREIGLASNIFDRRWHARAYDIAREFAPDIVHGAVYEGEALACSIGLRMPKAKVIMEETSDPVDRRWTGNALMRAMCWRADACVGVSPRVVDYLRGKLNISEKKIRLINNAVKECSRPSERRLNEIRAEYSLGQGDFIIGSVGRLLDTHKRFSDLIRALYLVRQLEPQAKLLIVGDGPDRKMLESLANELELSEAVIFVGYQAEPRDFYYLMDVFALASAHEAFGLVLVEAMLSRVPVVATAVGGIPFVLGEGKAGILVPPMAPEKISEAILQISKNPEVAETYRAFGLSRALSYFSEERYVSEVAQLYAELCRSEK